ncbi:MAG: PKD domain-containing protein, partial [Candidatus Altiarchaeota archaeon]
LNFCQSNSDCVVEGGGAGYCALNQEIDACMCQLPGTFEIVTPLSGTVYTHMSAPVDVTVNFNLPGTSIGCYDVAWDFGDGATAASTVCTTPSSRGGSIMHTYPGIGTFTITASLGGASVICPPDDALVALAALAAAPAVEPNTDSVSITIQREQYHPTATTQPAPPATIPPVSTTQPPAPPTTQPPAPSTTQPPVPQTSSPPTTIAPVTQTGGSLPVVQAQVDEGEPLVIGYAVSPLGDFSFQNGGFRNLLVLLVLIAGYAVWARDTQLMKRADFERRKGRK